MGMLLDPAVWMSLVGLVISLIVFSVKYIITFNGEESSRDANLTYKAFKNITKE